MKIKNWLMDMEDRAYFLLDRVSQGVYSIDQARAFFLEEFPGQQRIFDICLTMHEEDEHIYGQLLSDLHECRDDDME